MIDDSCLDENSHIDIPKPNKTPQQNENSYIHMSEVFEKHRPPNRTLQPNHPRDKKGHTHDPWMRPPNLIKRHYLHTNNRYRKISIILQDILHDDYRYQLFSYRLACRDSETYCVNMTPLICTPLALPPPPTRTLVLKH